MKKRDVPVRMAEVRLGDKEIAAVCAVLRSGKLREGDKCREFERRFAERVGAGAACTASSGTAALHMAYSYFVEEEDEVLVPAMSFFATASMVCWAGAKPVFCDISPDSFCIDVEDAKRRVTSRTKAIAPVHLFGQAANVDAILDFSNQHGLRVIWDAAQAHAAEYNGRDVGSLSGAVCYSFYATKNMTTGEGGMITTDDMDLHAHATQMKRQGQAQKYRHTTLGANYRMTDIQAAIGLVQLDKLDSYTRRRGENARFYNEALGEIAQVSIPAEMPDCLHSFHQYTITVEIGNSWGRDELQEKMMAWNVETAINYPIPLHCQPAFQQYTDKRLPLPHAENMARTCLSLPVHPFLGREDLQYVADVMRVSVRDLSGKK